MFQVIDRRDQLFGRSLTILVVHVIADAEEPIGNYPIRDHLLERMTPKLRGLIDADEAARLYERISTTTNALHADGILLRNECVGPNKHVTYTFDLCPA